MRTRAVVSSMLAGAAAAVGSAVVLVAGAGPADAQVLPGEQEIHYERIELQPISGLPGYYGYEGELVEWDPDDPDLAGQEPCTARITAVAWADRGESVAGVMVELIDGPSGVCSGQLAEYPGGEGMVWGTLGEDPVIAQYFWGTEDDPPEFAFLFRRGFSGGVEHGNYLFSFG